MPDYFVALAIAVAINGIFFVVAALRKTDTVTDLSYGLSFATVAVVLVVVKEAWDPIRLAAAALVLVWAIRLAAYLFRRILLIKVDHRFDGRREKPARFAIFWTLQAISVSIIMLPAIAAIGRPAPAFSPLHIFGAALWFLGLGIETIADAQKWAWKRAEGAGFVRTGLWSWSRHPNYFGEILVWWGIWLYALPSLSGFWHLALLGPVFITLLLVKVTGIPPLEKSAEARYGADPAYAEYRRRTSILLPLPPRGR
jgi:steroid 5-alpha reductase family enzyme